MYGSVSSIGAAQVNAAIAAAAGEKSSSPPKPATVAVISAEMVASAASTPSTSDKNNSVDSTSENGKEPEKGESAKAREQSSEEGRSEATVVPAKTNSGPVGPAVEVDVEPEEEVVEIFKDEYFCPELVASEVPMASVMKDLVPRNL